MMTDNTYNGWTNYETWNVALWIDNDYTIYNLVRKWVAYQLEEDQPVKYDILRHTLTELFGSKTSDGVDWNDTCLDEDELDEMLQEFVSIS